MKVIYTALAAALLCGAASLILPANAATDSATSGYSSPTATPSDATDASGTAQTKVSGTSEAKPAIKKRVAYARPKGGSEKAEQAETADLNRQMLQSAEAGNPTFTPSVATGNAPKRTQVAERTRKTNTSAKKRKSAGKSSL
jgi:hypothetical protein